MLTREQFAPLRFSDWNFNVAAGRMARRFMFCSDRTAAAFAAVRTLAEEIWYHSDFTWRGASAKYR
jgi:hypothetical protein